MTGTGVGPELIRLIGVDAGYNHQAVLHDVNIHVHEDQFTGIVGPSGSGKTTLAKYIFKKLKIKKLKVLIIDGDIFRKKNKQKKFTKKSIIKNNLSIINYLDKKKNKVRLFTCISNCTSTALKNYSWS